jgi:hypothetical protein
MLFKLIKKKNYILLKIQILWTFLIKIYLKMPKAHHKMIVSYSNSSVNVYFKVQLAYCVNLNVNKI